MMMGLAERLFPICRSLTGSGVRETLGILRKFMPGLVIHEVPSGTKVFDWTVPPEWNIRNAALIAPSGGLVANFKESNLHVVGYSEPVEREISLAELQPHLHSLPERPDAIPYVTSYYNRDWGFCIRDRERKALKDVTYRVFIDSTLDENGSLTYGELIIPGSSGLEVFISTYICHPSMANDQISGPVVVTFLADWLASQPRKYTYRIAFVPETIGSLTYLSRNLKAMKAKAIAGFNVLCVGDDRGYSFIASRYGDTYADRLMRHVMKHTDEGYREYSYLERGSDERQYCAPGIDLPLVAVMRGGFDKFPEYHTSDDNLSIISERGLAGGLEVMKRAIETVERDRIYESCQLGEPQFGKRDLYPKLGTAQLGDFFKTLRDVLTYCDGTKMVSSIAERLGRPAWELFGYFDELEAHGLIK